METATLCTAEELLTLPQEGWRLELVAGELRRMAPAGQEHGRVAMNLSWRIAQFVQAGRLGVVFAAETGFLLARDPDTVRAPDLAFVAAARLGGSSPLESGFFPGAPDLAVEVISPGDAYSAVEDKVFTWLAAGSRAVVVVDPRRRSVSIYRTARDIQVVGEGDTLDLDFVIPGFTLAVAELFR